VGGKARLPEPPRKLTRAEAAIVRGNADAVALKLACHDPAVHRRLVPGGRKARGAGTQRRGDRRAVSALSEQRGPVSAGRSTVGVSHRNLGAAGLRTAQVPPAHLEPGLAIASCNGGGGLDLQRGPGFDLLRWGRDWNQGRIARELL